MTLKHELDQLREQLAQRSTPAKQDLFARAKQAVRDLGLVETAAQAGDMAPDFNLPNQRGEFVSLESLLRRGPAVVVFYRGGWCPYCNLTLRAWRNILPEIAAAHAGLVAIAPTRQDQSKALAGVHNLGFDLLSDGSGRVAKLFGLLYEMPAELVRHYRDAGTDVGAYNADGRYNIPVPAAYVVGRTGLIRYAALDADYERRAEPAEVLAALAAIAETVG
jgi:peroxiredoxin